MVNIHVKLVLFALSILALQKADAAPVEPTFLRNERSVVVEREVVFDSNNDDGVNDEVKNVFYENHKDTFELVGPLDTPIEELTDDEMTTVDDGNGNQEPLDEIPSEGTYQGDMMLTNQQWDDLDELLDSDNWMDDDNVGNDQGNEPAARAKRKATVFTERYWPRGVVPVEFNVKASTKNLATKAMLYWMKHTCLRFTYYSEEVSRWLGHTSRIQVVDQSSGCWSYVGRTFSTSQPLNIGPGCETFGIILHELAHAIGFLHEHSRYDRDNYITVHRENIDPKQLRSFARYSWNQVTTKNIPYDLGSIVHYGAYAFSKNGKATITTKDASKQNLLGQRRVLSASDIALANILYNCTRQARGK